MSTVPTSSCNDDVRTKWLAYYMSRRGRPSREKRVRHRDEVVDQPIFMSKMLIHAMEPKRLNQQAKILPSLFLKPLNKRQELTPVHHVQTRLTPKFWLKCLVCVSCKISAFLLQFPSRSATACIRSRTYAYFIDPRGRHHCIRERYSSVCPVL